MIRFRSYELDQDTGWHQDVFVNDAGEEVDHWSAIVGLDIDPPSGLFIVTDDKCQQGSDEKAQYFQLQAGEYILFPSKLWHCSAPASGTRAILALAFLVILRIQNDHF